MSIFRGNVRGVAEVAIASFHLTDPDEAAEYLLQDLTYIYPVDPFVGVVFLPSVPIHCLHLHSHKRRGTINRIVILPSSRLYDTSSSIWRSKCTKNNIDRARSSHLA